MVDDWHIHHIRVLYKQCKISESRGKNVWVSAGKSACTGDCCKGLDVSAFLLSVERDLFSN